MAPGGSDKPFHGKSAILIRSEQRLPNLTANGLSVLSHLFGPFARPVLHMHSDRELQQTTSNHRFYTQLEARQQTSSHLYENVVTLESRRCSLQNLTSGYYISGAPRRPILQPRRIDTPPPYCWNLKQLLQLLLLAPFLEFHSSASNVVTPTPLETSV